MLAAGLADTDAAKACVVNSLRSGSVVDGDGAARASDRSLTTRTADLTSVDALILHRDLRDVLSARAA